MVVHCSSAHGATKWSAYANNLSQYIWTTEVVNCALKNFFEADQFYVRAIHAK